MVDGPFIRSKPKIASLPRTRAPQRRNELRRASIPVDEALDALVPGAMDAAIDRVAVLHAVADDAHAAMWADRRERGDGAFERVEHERAPAHGDLEALVVVVAALRAFAHGCFSFDSYGKHSNRFVILAQAGTQRAQRKSKDWIPAFAGMTRAPRSP